MNNASDTVTLYHSWGSICSIKVRHCLEEKGVEWESRALDLSKFEQLDPEYLKLNPNGVVPTLVVGDNPIIESSVINEFIDEYFEGPDLKSTDLFRRAEMREFIKYCDDVVLPAIHLPSLVRRIKPRMQEAWDDLDALKQLISKKPKKLYRDRDRRALEDDIDPQEINEALEELENMLDKIGGKLEDRNWLMGDFSLADIAVATHMHRLEILEMERFWKNGERPQVASWWKRIQQRPAFQTALRNPEEEDTQKTDAANTAPSAGPEQQG